MEVVTGALPSVLTKLGELLKEDLRAFMKAALQDLSKIPVDKLPNHDKIWARNVRELSYDIEDNIDTFMVLANSSKQEKRHGIKNLMDKTIGSLLLPKMRRNTALDIREIKTRVEEAHKLRRNYKVKHTVDMPVKVDPRTLVRYENITALVGIDEAKDEVIEMMLESNGVSKQPDKVVSIVGFGGLGKTTLANVVYRKLRAQFDCSAFVSVSQTPDVQKLLKDMFYQFAKKSTESVNVINELREFLQERRYFIIIDDIWDISHWSVIRCALPESDGYRIITTTRIITIAEQIGGPYKMKPLSIENSRILMYGRIFGEEYKDKCPDKELAEVSNRILKKCAGVPLAIITIASLLVNKGRDKLEWYKVCSSIGSGLMVESSMKNMTKVLSLSYYDMPSHLRTCLLYLSVFPEDYKIDKDRLIWSWIAQGFIQSGNQEKRLFEIGESYFNELINRSMIQPVNDDYIGMIEHCCVHDVVLDLICSLSSEENFVTIDNYVVHTSVPRQVRRLSLQNSKKDHDKREATINIEHVRSIVVFQPAIDLMPALQKFRVLRVLDLGGCFPLHGYNLKCLGNLLHLRYLGLRDTHINQLPEEVGNLQFLQTLDLRDSSIARLPSTIVQLTHLMCLRIDSRTGVPSGIGSLTSIEELSELRIPYDSIDIINELGKLVELRKLTIIIIMKWNSLTECLDKLQKLQSLHIWHPSYGTQKNLLLDLSYLSISVKWLQQEGLEILGRLSALRFLILHVDQQELGIHGRFAIVASSFPCLLDCFLFGFGGRVVFQQGAMPRVTELRLDFPVREMEELNGRFLLGVENLLSLQEVTVWFECEGASEEKVKKAKAALQDSIRIHPNRPKLEIYGVDVEVESDSGEDSVDGSGKDEDED
ncbi:hypothetical protein ACP4OV_002394 [Aristida adscensionis]